MATSEDGREVNPTAARMLSGLTGRDYERQTTGGDYTPLHLPWRGDDRQADKTRIWEYVRRESAGVRFSKVVRDVFGSDAVEDADKDYNMARRFVTSCEYLETARRGGVLWVEPSLSAFHLSKQYVNRKTSGRRGDGQSGVQTGGETGDSRQADSLTGDMDGVEDSDDRGEQFPKDRAKATISKRVFLDGRNGRHDYRQELVRQLATERAIQSDKFQIFERVRGTGPGHLLVPYLTRFNDGDRAGEIQAGFTTALDRAAESYQDAVVLTVTPDPRRHDSVQSALDSIAENKGRLMSWLATDYQVGQRPDNMTVLEWQDSGLPHYHIVLFGVSWLMHQSALAAKWDDLGTGAVVDVRSIDERGGQWLMHNDDGRTVTLRQYLGEAIRQNVELAGMDAEDFGDAVEDGDLSGDCWKVALYWATGRQFYSCSPSLKPDSGGVEDDLPHVTQWRFRGVASYQEIPAHVRTNAVVLNRSRPPPATASTASGTGATAAGD